MEPAERLQALQDTQRLRAELAELRATLAKLRESAWPEDKTPVAGAEEPTTPADLLATDAAEAASFVAVINNACDADDDAAEEAPSAAAGPRVTEEEVRQAIEAGAMLASGRGTECRGCCLLRPPSGSQGSEAAAPFGTVAVLAVRADSRRRGVALRLLTAAEELLAGRHQCGEVRVELSAAQDHLRSWLERRGYEKLQVCGKDPNGQVLSKTLPIGFVSRSLVREMATREAALTKELHELESREAEVLRVQQAQGSAAGLSGPSDDDVPGSIWGTDSPLTFMPQDVWAAISSALSVKDFGALAPSCRVLGQEAGDPEVWRSLCMVDCWPACPALLNFVEGVNRPAAFPWREVFQKRTEASPVIVVDVGRGYTKYGLVHGVHGRPEGDAHAPRIVQLCSSPTHPPDCEHNDQLQFIEGELDDAFRRAAANPGHLLHRFSLVHKGEPEAGCFAVLKGLVNRPELNGNLVYVDQCDEETGKWQAALTSGDSSKLKVAAANLARVRRAHELPILIGEPFAVTASRYGNPRSAATWAMSMKRQLGERRGAVKVVPQAQMALWAHGIDHGIVVNIGQGQTIAIPVVRGEIQAASSCVADIGSGSLTQLMMRLLSHRFNFVNSGLMTWCRDLKEAYCYVAPPVASGQVGGLRARLASAHGSDDVGIRPVTVDSGFEGMDAFELRAERVLVPEAFFDRGMLGGPTVPELIVGCLEKVKETCEEREVLQALLRNIVLVGGAADLPGIRPRTEFEVRALLKNRASERLKAALDSPDDVFVLNPPLLGQGPGAGAQEPCDEAPERTAAARPQLSLCTPRFAPFAGGCVRAVGSQSLFEGEPADPGLAAAGGQLGSVARQRQEHRGTIAAWVRSRLFDLNAPAIFRTGGGGGEDDGTWGVGFDTPVDSEDDDIEDEEEQEEPDELDEHEPEEDEEKSSSSEEDEEAFTSSLRADAEPFVPGGAAAQAPPAPPGRRGRSGSGRSRMEVDQDGQQEGRLRYAPSSRSARTLAFRA